MFLQVRSLDVCIQRAMVLSSSSNVLVLGNKECLQMRMFTVCIAVSIYIVDVNHLFIASYELHFTEFVVKWLAGGLSYTSTVTAVRELLNR